MTTKEFKAQMAVGTIDYDIVRGLINSKRTSALMLNTITECVINRPIHAIFPQPSSTYVLLHAIFFHPNISAETKLTIKSTIGDVTN